MSKLSSLLCTTTLLFGSCVTAKQQVSTELTQGKITEILQTYIIKKSAPMQLNPDRKDIGIDDTGKPISDTVQIVFGGRIYFLVKSQNYTHK